MMGLFDFYGFCTNPADMRALSEAEIQKIQYANYAGMQNVSIYNQSQANVLGATDAFRPADKPLGERFLDFKRRLAAAVDRRKPPH